MFVVGKKYIKAFNVYECLGVHLFRNGSVAGVMRFDGRTDEPNDMGDIPHVHAYSSDWKEHHELVVEKITRSVHEYQRGCDDGYCISKGDMSGLHKLGNIELTITDGKLTDVRIVA